MKKRLLIIIPLVLFALVVCIGVPLGFFGGNLRLTQPEATQTQAVAGDILLQTQPDAPSLPETEPTTEPTEPLAAMPEITWKTFPDDREMTSTKAFVYDCTSESYIYLLGDPTEKIYPASITKLMSIHLASQYLEMDWKKGISAPWTCCWQVCCCPAVTMPPTSLPRKPDGRLPEIPIWVWMKLWPPSLRR